MKINISPNIESDLSVLLNNMFVCQEDEREEAQDHRFPRDLRWCHNRRARKCFMNDLREERQTESSGSPDDPAGSAGGKKDDFRQDTRHYSLSAICDNAEIPSTDCSELAEMMVEALERGDYVAGMKDINYDPVFYSMPNQNGDLLWRCTYSTVSEIRLCGPIVRGELRICNVVLRYAYSAYSCVWSLFEHRLYPVLLFMDIEPGCILTNYHNPYFYAKASLGEIGSRLVELLKKAVDVKPTWTYLYDVHQEFNIAIRSSFNPYRKFTISKYISTSRSKAPSAGGAKTDTVMNPDDNSGQCRQLESPAPSVKIFNDIFKTITRIDLLAKRKAKQEEKRRKAHEEYLAWKREREEEKRRMLADYSDSDVRHIRQWCSSDKSFSQIDKENRLPPGTLYRLVNSISDFRGTRQSIRFWLSRQMDLRGGRDR